MLAQTLVLVTLIATFALAAIGGIAGSARARTAATAKALVAPGVATALATYLRDVAATVAAGVPPGDGSAPPGPIGVLQGRGVFAVARYVERAPDSPLTIAVEVTPAGPPSACAAPAAQCSPFVQESRLSLDVVADVGIAGADGTVTSLAHGRSTVTLRLFAQPPYATIAGAKDGALAGEPREGDAGAAPIGVVYRCVPAAGDCANSRPPAPP